MLNKLIHYFLANKLVTALLLLLLVGWGLVTAPFGWEIGALPSDPVAVDAIPDIGENQQIVLNQRAVSLASVWRPVGLSRWTWVCRR